MTNDSMVHVMDRFMAVSMMILNSWKIHALFFHVRPGTFCTQLAAFSFAAFAFLNSQDAQESHDTDGFVFWHNAWHVYPIHVILIEIYDNFVLGEYDAEAVRKANVRISSPSSLFQNLKSSLCYADSSDAIQLAKGSVEKRHSL